MADAPNRALAAGHEPDQPHLKGVAIGAGAIIAAVVIAIVVAFFVVHGVRDIAAYAPHPPPAVAGGPRLQATPQKDFPAFHAQKLKLLNEYAWVDRAHGVVRIPIERAMQVLVERQAQGGAANGGPPRGASEGRAPSTKARP